MKAAFFFDSRVLGRDWDIAISKQALSGTDSILLQVFDELSSDSEVILLSTNAPNLVDRKVHNLAIVDNLTNAYEYCLNKKISFLIFGAKEGKEQELFLTYASDKETQLISWAQNTPSFNWCTNAYKCKSFYRLVAVSNIQRSSLVHHIIYDKTIVIPNFVDESLIKSSDKTISIDNQIITYVGALKDSKGFHHLAKVWPKIHRRFPKACLDVCGSPGLYKSDSMLGTEGIAEEGYENKILSFLGGTKVSAQEFGVHFLGSVPKEILYNKMALSTIVVVNLNTYKDGSVETFCVSAAEAMALEVPVIGGAAGGLLEIVGHQMGGILVDNSTKLEQAIIKLLNDRNYANKLSKIGNSRVRKFYTKDNSIKRWKALLSNEIISNNTMTDVNIYDMKYYKKYAAKLLLPSSMLKWLREKRRDFIYRKM
ncbi:glycosyltransferase family 4 protein [Fibrella aquatica]|uniref:glycosyltransferase family 4 protein n=1 Tax=Fibrella aquatica TaxID=3242487 RepID=UPI0035211A65